MTVWQRLAASDRKTASIHPASDAKPEHKVRKGQPERQAAWQRRRAKSIRGQPAKKEKAFFKM
jgi:hypothetical protein